MCIINEYGLVAQLGERSVRIREVEGSNPFRSTKKAVKFCISQLFSAFERSTPESGIRKGGRLENFMAWRYNEIRKGEGLCL